MNKQIRLDGEMIKELGTSYIIVRQLLKLNPVARNNDELLIKIVKTYCKSNKLLIPASETITRCRRKIQYNEGKFLASEDVIKRRQERERQFSEFFGSDNR